MAWSLLRGTILRRISISIRSENLILKARGSFFRSVSSDSEGETEGDDERDPGQSIIDRTTRFVRHAIRCQKETGIVYRSLIIIFYDSIFDTLSLDSKLLVLSRVFHHIRNLPQADPYEVYLMNTYIKSMSNDDSKTDIDKGEIISRVLDVIQSHPAVDSEYKVMEDTHLRKDLMFDDFDEDQLRKALYFEFKLYISPGMPRTCHQITDFIYQRRQDRIGFEGFRKLNRIGGKFWPVPL